MRRTLSRPTAMTIAAATTMVVIATIGLLGARDQPEPAATAAPVTAPAGPPPTVPPETAPSTTTTPARGAVPVEQTRWTPERLDAWLAGVLAAGGDYAREHLGACASYATAVTDSGALTEECRTVLDQVPRPDRDSVASWLHRAADAVGTDAASNSSTAPAPPTP